MFHVHTGRKLPDLASGMLIFIPCDIYERGGEAASLPFALAIARVHNNRCLYIKLSQVCGAQ